MKIFILILSLVLLTNLDLYGNPNSPNIDNVKKARIERFKVKWFKPYRNDTDTGVIGDMFLLFNKIESKKTTIQNKIKDNKENKEPKFKSTYLEFTILTEENIS
jgi:hypothetical protein